MSNDNITILVVDDNDAILRLFNRAISASGAKIVQCCSIDIARECFSAEIDMVVLDINLGLGKERGGIELLKEFRKYDEKIPIYMMSGYENVDILYECVLAGANDFVCKTCSPSLFMNYVKGLITDSNGAVCSNYKPLEDCTFLKSKKLCSSQLHILSVYVENGFPDLCDLSTILKTSENAVVKRFRRIEKQLGLHNRAGLVRLLTICSRFRLSQHQQLNEMPCIGKQLLEFPSNEWN